MYNILVTGGAGFIGSNFIRYMLEKHNECRIINLDKLTYAANLTNLSGIDEDRYALFKGDICNKELVNNLFEKYSFRYIVNFAAESHVDRSIADPEIFIKSNVLGTQVLLDACKKNWLCGEGIETATKKFLQISTDEVYGTLGSNGYFTEETPLAPNSPYSASKASADMIVRSYKETYNLNVNITRCSNNYGPFQFCEKLIPLMISNALEEKPLPVYGDGLNVRDWLYVEDHCRAIDLVLHSGKSGEVYNIGGNNEKTNLDIVKIILKEIGKPESLITFVQDRPGHDKRYAIDASKIRKELGWEPQVDFVSGMKRTIDYYRSIYNQ
jgi:dTDP-glucose 4,6-dehydratase